MKGIINRKNIYLLMLFVICLLGIVIVPTYAKFGSNYITDDDVVGLSLNFDLKISNIEEYEEIILSSGSTEQFNIEVTNNTNSDIYYGVWYKVVSPKEFNDDIVVARLNGSTTSTSGTIGINSSVNINLVAINNTANDVVINIGVGSSLTNVSDIEYLGGKKLITETNNSLLSNMIISNYNDSSKKSIISIGDITEKLTVSLNTNKGIMLDNNGQYRYYGINPNNYVKFNNELWRIISVGNVKSSMGDVSGEKRVKIIKATPLVDDNGLSAFSFDSSDSLLNSGYGENDWKQSDLMKELNSLYFNSDKGICFIGNGNVSSDCSFVNTGLTEESKNLITDAVYYLGGGESLDKLYLNNYYTNERGLGEYKCSLDDSFCFEPTIWSGMIGLMYISDYAYASDINICKDYVSNYYKNVNCYGSNWLLYTGGNQLTMFLDNLSLNSVFNINLNGEIKSFYSSSSAVVRPVLYLRSNVYVLSGDGTENNPYVIG